MSLQKNQFEKLLSEELSVLMPPDRRNPSAADLHRTVRLLLLCRSRQERLIVGLHVYHGRPLAALATSLCLPLGHVNDLFESLCVREGKAMQSLRTESRLARLEGRAVRKTS